MMKCIIRYSLSLIIVISIAGFSSYFIAKSRAIDIATTFDGSLSPLRGDLALFGEESLAPCWIFKAEYSNAMTGATFDVYISFWGKVLKQPSDK